MFSKTSIYFSHFTFGLSVFSLVESYNVIYDVSIHKLLRKDDTNLNEKGSLVNRILAKM